MYTRVGPSPREGGKYDVPPLHHHSRTERPCAASYGRWGRWATAACAGGPAPAAARGSVSSGTSRRAMIPHRGPPRLRAREGGQPEGATSGASHACGGSSATTAPSAYTAPEAASSLTVAGACRCCMHGGCASTAVVPAFQKASGCVAETLERLVAHDNCLRGGRGSRSDCVTRRAAQPPYLSRFAGQRWRATFTRSKVFRAACRAVGGRHRLVIHPEPGSRPPTAR